jgi:hypothetical protein
MMMKNDGYAQGAPHSLGCYFSVAYWVLPGGYCQ